VPRTITADFDIRREAEMAVERLVQEYGIDRSAVQVGPVSDDNTVGTRPSGADKDSETGDAGASPTHGRIRVSATIDDAVADRAQEALRQARD
jgi:hypothetical protein